MGFGAGAVLAAALLVAAAIAGGCAADTRRDCRRTASRPQPRSASGRAGRRRADVPDALGRTSARSSLQPAAGLLRARRPAGRRRGVRRRTGLARQRRRPPLHLHRVRRRRRSAANGSVNWPCRFPTSLPRLGNDRFFADLSVSRSGRVENEFWGLGNDSPEDVRSGVPARADRRGWHVRRAADAVAERGGERVAAGRQGSRRRDRATPSITDVFDESTAPGLTRQPPFFRVRDRGRSRLPRFDSADPDGRPARSPAARRRVARRTVSGDVRLVPTIGNSISIHSARPRSTCSSSCRCCTAIACSPFARWPCSATRRAARWCRSTCRRRSAV